MGFLPRIWGQIDIRSKKLLNIDMLYIEIGVLRVVHSFLESVFEFDIIWPQNLELDLISEVKMTSKLRKRYSVDMWYIKLRVVVVSNCYFGNVWYVWPHLTLHMGFWPLIWGQIDTRAWKHLNNDLLYIIIGVLGSLIPFLEFVFRLKSTSNFQWHLIKIT